jgi:hypothetical protein
LPLLFAVDFDKVNQYDEHTEQAIIALVKEAGKGVADESSTRTKTLASDEHPKSVVNLQRAVNAQTKRRVPKRVRKLSHSSPSHDNVNPLAGRNPGKYC